MQISIWGICLKSDLAECSPAEQFDRSLNLIRCLPDKQLKTALNFQVMVLYDIRKYFSLA